MKNLIKVFFAVTITILFLFGSEANSYNNNYIYKGIECSISIPENIQMYEYKLYSGQCNNLKIYGCKIAYINTLLIKKGLTPLYY